MKHRWVTLFVLGALLLIGAWTTFFMSPAFAGDNRWDPIGLYGGYVTDVAVDPRNANIVYAGVYSTGLYKSSDGGASWSHIFPMSGGYATVAVAPTNSSVLYLNVWMSDRRGLYRSSNGASTASIAAQTGAPPGSWSARLHGRVVSGQFSLHRRRLTLFTQPGETESCAARTADKAGRGWIQRSLRLPSSTASQSIRTTPKSSILERMKAASTKPQMAVHPGSRLALGLDRQAS